MISVYIKLIKKYLFLILTLGLAYGATIVFTFWGPILNATAGNSAPLLSIIAVTAHVLGFYLKPFKLEQHRAYFTIYLIVLTPLLLSFNTTGLYLKIITVVLYAFLIARIGCFWAYRANRVIPNHIRGKIISASLFISFVILYLVNMSIPALPGPVCLILPLVLSILAVVCIKKACRKYDYYYIKSNETGKKVPSFFLFAFLIIVYIAGGFSYAGIYPSFVRYAHIDRFYNVLFYIISILIGGIILDTYGRKITFTLGVACLGISFTFFIMPQSILTYLITQTFLQAGWAFVNSFGWSFSWDIAEQTKRSELFPRGISAMLLGASLGAVLAYVLSRYQLSHSSVYGLVTFIPLFLAIVFLVYFPETLRLNRTDPISIKHLSQLNELNLLTPRELEVCVYLANGSSTKHICSSLYISENTVKTHIRNIYSKLSISSRHELREFINSCLTKLI